jgi:hypothetical protein
MLQMPIRLPIDCGMMAMFAYEQPHIDRGEVMAAEFRNVRIPAEAHERLQRLSALGGRSMSALIAAFRGLRVALPAAPDRGRMGALLQRRHLSR